MGHLSLGDHSVQAKKIPDAVPLRVLVCYTVLVTTNALSPVEQHPHLFSRLHCNLRNLGFTDTFASAF